MITLEEFKKKQLDKCRLIGLDLGSKRIGVSICDEKQLIATPFKTIKKSTLKELVVELKKIIKEKDINYIVSTGPPHSMHLIALELKKMYGHIKWIADFRDPWTKLDILEDFSLINRHLNKRDTSLKGKTVFLTNFNKGNISIKQRKYINPNKYQEKNNLIKENTLASIVTKTAPVVCLATL